MTKAELVNNIAIQTGYDRVTIMNIVESAMFTVKKTMAEGQNVYLRGFGSLVIKTRKEKVARNIKSNTSLVVPEHRIPSFKASPEFLNMMN
ncbi:MAG: integration host factor subunit beta [Paludibacteraceae bacterium]|nr:integration host factor subunit beta [Paludibacteraceae bacterium]